MIGQPQALVGEKGLAPPALIPDNAREARVRFDGHVIGLLKEYMGDLVEQARQETDAYQTFGLSSSVYRPDQALSDLLAILDDRIESEGVQVGLPADFLHRMWSTCNEAHSHVRDRVWLETNVSPHALSKALVRELTYRALLDYIEHHADSSSDGPCADHN